jgi:HK97 family phage portal protein
MGLRDIILGITPPQSVEEGDHPVTASLASARWPTWEQLTGASGVNVARNQAMTVPTIARARNIVAGSISGLALYRFTSDGRDLMAAPWMRQPDPLVPRQTTFAWTVDSLFFYGVAYWQVLDVYAEDGRPSRFRWIDPVRVSPETNRDGTMVEYYKVDGKRVPERGLNSLVVFSGYEEGLLRRGGRTIRTAIQLEQAALTYAETPSPMVALKNSGSPLPTGKVTELLAAWKQARNQSSTAYLNESIDIERVGFSPSEMALTEARMATAQELARAAGIPPWYLGVDAGSSMTYQNVGNSRRDLLDFALMPFITAIEQRLSLDDILVSREAVKFDLTDFLRSSPIERAQLYQALVPLGILTPDEVRKLEDLAPGESNTR